MLIDTHGACSVILAQKGKGTGMSITKTLEKKRRGTRIAGGKRSATRTRRLQLRIFVPILLILCVLLGVCFVLSGADNGIGKIDNPKVARLARIRIPSWIDQDIIPKDSDSRRGEYLEDFGGIVIHYVGNPGTGAKQNRNYYANPGTEVNSHFLVGLKGEVVQCLPMAEKSSASNERNRDTISIEVCHADESGEFSKESYAALLRLTAWLCKEGGIIEDQVIRHYDVTGKICPKYYVDNPQAWDAFKEDLKQAIKADN